MTVLVYLRLLESPDDGLTTGCATATFKRSEGVITSFPVLPVHLSCCSQSEFTFKTTGNFLLLLFFRLRLQQRQVTASFPVTLLVLFCLHFILVSCSTVVWTISLDRKVRNRAKISTGRDVLINNCAYVHKQMENSSKLLNYSDGFI